MPAQRQKRCQFATMLPETTDQVVGPSLGQVQLERRVPNKISRSLRESCQWTKHCRAPLRLSPHLPGNVIHLHDRHRRCNTLKLYLAEVATH